jgi:hypothetical protein
LEALAKSPSRGACTGESRISLSSTHRDLLFETSDSSFRLQRPMIYGHSFWSSQLSSA